VADFYDEEMETSMAKALALVEPLLPSSWRSSSAATAAGLLPADVRGHQPDQSEGSSGG
jgi:hypothetical protein